MGKAILTFVILSTLIGFGIQVLRSMSGREKWALTKTVSYAIMCSTIAAAALIVFVVLF